MIQNWSLNARRLSALRSAVVWLCPRVFSLAIGAVLAFEGNKNLFLIPRAEKPDF
jgi:hypothetical protein